MKETTAKKRGLSSDRIFDIFNYALMAVIMIVVAYPLYYVLIASISNPYEVYAGHTFLLPADITFEGYARVFKEPAIAMGYLNSIWYTVLGTVVTVAMTITTGYCMSKKTLPFRRAIMLFFVFTMYFNGGLIPTYLVVSKLQLLDSVWALILPGGISVYNVIVTRTFFETSVPGEIYEAASIDGSGNLETYFKIALPLAKPIIAVMVIFTMVGYWNDWYQSMLYIDNTKLLSLQALLNQILTNIQMLVQNAATLGASAAEMLAKMPKEAARMSIVVIIVLPIACAYPFFQQYFISGLTVGAVKG